MTSTQKIYTIEKISTAAKSVEIIFPATAKILPNICTFSNMNDYNEIFAHHHQSVVYVEREAISEEIAIVRLPPGVLVLADDGFPMRVDDVFIEEQWAPWLRANPDSTGLISNKMSSINYTINEPCLLLARFGEGTWGHWLGELLPRAVVAECQYPGRFKYIVPEWSTTGNSSLSKNILGSLHSYGIDESRLIRLKHGNCYEFTNLHSVTSVRSNSTMHPEILSLMRNNVILTDVDFGGYSPSRIALLRKDTGRRGIDNSEEVFDFLKKKNFYFFEGADINFSTQIFFFREALSVFCVLGSGLTNCIFSPDGVKVVAPAPEDWGDSFFYPLIQARSGKFADVRGKISQLNLALKRDSAFLIDIEKLDQAFQSLGM